MRTPAGNYSNAVLCSQSWSIISSKCHYHLPATCSTSSSISISEWAGLGFAMLTLRSASLTPFQTQKDYCGGAFRRTPERSSILPTFPNVLRPTLPNSVYSYAACRSIVIVITIQASVYTPERAAPSFPPTVFSCFPELHSQLPLGLGTCPENGRSGESGRSLDRIEPNYYLKFSTCQTLRHRWATA